MYDEREARAVIRYVLEALYGLTTADIYAHVDAERARLGEGASRRGRLQSRPFDLSDDLEMVMRRLEAGEPVQYVVGSTTFCGHTLSVQHGVLIPRPETEELCRWIIDSTDCNRARPLRILDIGTGSGCIAITLALDIQGADVTAWDISETALDVAQRNAIATGATVVFDRRNILDEPTADEPLFDLIVSNPPYICNKERADMHSNVTDYEPHEALFVPDDDPLLFYRAIARYARCALCPGGRLYLEVNPLTVAPLCTMLPDVGFDDIEQRNDSFGRQRFIRCCRGPEPCTLNTAVPCAR